MNRLLILVSLILIFSSVAKADDAYERVKASSTSLGIFLDGGVGNVFSSSVQYFFANNIFVKGGLRIAQSTITSNGISNDIKSNGVDIGMGVAHPINNFIVASLTGTYEYFLYDVSSGGNSLSGSNDGNGLGIGASLEFFVNPKSSFGMGVAYHSLTGTYRNTGSSFSENTTGFTTGWKFYF